jgi:8-oxo-dGTP pyrophosphatase MutT (NUDIX family)
MPARYPPRVPTPGDWPEYCCAIIVGPDGRLLLESRPLAARHAAGSLTCFGGRREPGETPRACIERELREELDTPVELDASPPAVTLLGDAERAIAWFYTGRVSETAPACLTPGHAAVWVGPGALPGERMSPWHAAVLVAWRRGETVARVR